MKVALVLMIGSAKAWRVRCESIGLVFGITSPLDRSKDNYNEICIFRPDPSPSQNNEDSNDVVDFGAQFLKRVSTLRASPSL